MRVVLNAAVSLDGKLALAGGRPVTLSSEEDLARVHRLRAEVDGVLVGSQTVLNDDPSLLVKEKYVTNPRQPARVVLDARGRLPPTARVFDGRASCLVFTRRDPTPRWPHAEVVRVPASSERAMDPGAVVTALEKRGMERLLVEGGGRVIRSFLDAGVVDEVTVYMAPLLVGSGAPSLFEGPAAESVEGVCRLALVAAETLGGGVLLTLKPRKPHPVQGNGENP